MQKSYVPETLVCNRHHAISLLLSHDPELLDFFFTEDRLSLRFVTPEKMLRRASVHIDRSQVLLVRIALDFWLDSGRCGIAEIVRGLAKSRFEAYLMAFESLYATCGCRCQNCRQRQVEWSDAERLFPEVF